MENLWPSFESSESEANDAVSILREQAKFLQKGTNGKIKATFSKMNYKSGTLAAISQLGKTMEAVTSATSEEVLDDELEGKKDVNVLFRITKYKFEIYNDEYRFRLFELLNRDVFPIQLDVDSGILDDISYTNKEYINSNDELKNIVKDIFSSKKVQTVITHLMGI